LIESTFFEYESANETHTKRKAAPTNRRYCLNKGNDSKAAFFKRPNIRDAYDFIETFPVIRSEMDSWFARHHKAGGLSSTI
jgi:hypothetical protein